MCLKLSTILSVGCHNRTKQRIWHIRLCIGTYFETPAVIVHKETCTLGRPLGTVDQNKNVIREV
jgi:hypothetical protein